MKRIRRIYTHKRHWLWYGFSSLIGVAGAAQAVLSAEAHPVAYFALSAFCAVGGIVAQACKPQDDGNA